MSDQGAPGQQPAGGAAPNAIAQPPGRSQVARLAPAVLLTVHTEPCVGVAFTREALLTACFAGLVRGRRFRLLLHPPCLECAPVC